MSKPTYKSYAIWGAGNLGARIANNLLERKAAVIILTRPVSVSFTLCQ
jgi:predicted dinucleotide-binding enzyme